jgi:hypothetical protein
MSSLPSRLHNLHNGKGKKHAVEENNIGAKRPHSPFQASESLQIVTLYCAVRWYSTHCYDKSNPITRRRKKKEKEKMASQARVSAPNEMALYFLAM